MLNQSPKIAPAEFERILGFYEAVENEHFLVFCIDDFIIIIIIIHV